MTFYYFSKIELFLKLSFQTNVRKMEHRPMNNREKFSCVSGVNFMIKPNIPIASSIVEDIRA